MKRTFSVFLLLAVLVGLIAFAPTEAPLSAVSASSVADAQSQLADVKSKIEDLDKKLAALSDKKEDQMAQKEIIDQQVQALNDTIAVYDTLIADLDVQIEEKNQEIVASQQRYDEYMVEYKAHARANYETGEISYLEVLLGASDFSDFLMRLDYVRQVMEYDNLLLKNIQAETDRIEQAKQQLTDDMELQLQARAEVEADRQALLDKEAAIDKLIASIRADEATLQKEHDRGEAQEREFEKLIEDLRMQGNQSQGPVKYDDSEWLWPCPGYSYVSSPFGWRTLHGKREFHYAVDLAAPANTPIYAAKSGRVLFSGWSPYGGGWQVSIDHGNGYVTYYNHMIRQSSLRAGDTVKQGQQVGNVGKTGNATGNHLDFKIMINGTAVDPLKYIKPPK